MAWPENLPSWTRLSCPCFRFPRILRLLFPQHGCRQTRCNRVSVFSLASLSALFSEVRGLSHRRPGQFLIPSGSLNDSFSPFCGCAPVSPEGAPCVTLFSRLLGVVPSVLCIMIVRMPFSSTAHQSPGAFSFVVFCQPNEET